MQLYTSNVKVDLTVCNFYVGKTISKVDGPLPGEEEKMHVGRGMLDDEVRLEGNAQEPQGEGLLVLKRAVREGLPVVVLDKDLEAVL